MQSRHIYLFFYSIDNAEHADYVLC